MVIFGSVDTDHLPKYFDGLHAGDVYVPNWMH